MPNIAVPTPTTAAGTARDSRGTPLVPAIWELSAAGSARLTLAARGWGLVGPPLRVLRGGQVGGDDAVRRERPDPVADDRRPAGPEAAVRQPREAGEPTVRAQAVGHGARTVDAAVDAHRQ